MKDETDEITFDRFAMFDIERWLGSDTYQKTTGEERRLLVPFFLWHSQNGPILDDAFLLYRIAYSDEVEAGPPFLSRIRETLAKAFVLDGREWKNKTAMKCWLKGHRAAQGRADRARIAGLASAEKRRVQRDVQPTVQPDVERDVQRPSTSTSPSPIEVSREVGSMVTALIPFEPPVEAEVIQAVRPRRNVAFELAELYLRALFERRRAVGDRSPYIPPPKATIGKAAVMISKALEAGKDPKLLASLPALVDEKVMQETHNPYAFLEDGSAPRTAREGYTLAATDHAANLGAKLQGLVVSARQGEILRLIETLEWAQSRGVRIKGTYQREGA